MIRVTFADEASRDNFAKRFNLTDKVETTKLDIPWHLLQFAKLDIYALDYDELAVLTASPEAHSEREFVVKGDPAVFGAHATVKQDLGNGFYLVTSTDGTLLGDHVDSIEHNSSGIALMDASSVTNLVGEVSTLDPTSADAQWARIRVVSRYRPLAKSFSTHDLVYLSKPEVYVMDSGINFSHPEFNYPGFESEDFYTCYPGSFNDDVGHGTAVTSMIAGKNLGVASHVKICNIKVGNSSGTASLLQIGQAIDAILARVSSDPLKTRIVNMSWGTARSAWLDSKVQGLIDAGVTVICAAGNNGVDVQDISPAGIVAAITVASSDKYDIPSGFNDISPSDAGVTNGSGLSLDIFAPGEGVMVAECNGGYKISNGTSFSAPLVAGVAATIASVRQGVTLGDELKNLVLSTATRDALLFTDDRFSENQNNLVFLFTSDSNEAYKSKNLSMYLGIHDDSGNPILANMKSAIDTSSWTKVLPDAPVTWSIKFLSPEVEATYSQYFEVKPETGMLGIHKPNTTLPAETKLKIVDFIICATNGVVSAESCICFFFDTNPLYKSTQEGDITLALTETDSISFYSSWGIFIK
jgi:hypothetical protein